MLNLRISPLLLQVIPSILQQLIFDDIFKKLYKFLQSRVKVYPSSISLFLISGWNCNVSLISFSVHNLYELDILLHVLGW